MVIINGAAAAPRVTVQLILLPLHALLMAPGQVQGSIELLLYTFFWSWIVGCGQGARQAREGKHWKVV